MEKGLVSVIIPTHNRATLLAECLGSLRHQQHEGWEAIVVDDGSSDGTAEIIAELVKGDDRIRSLRIEGQGAPFARNLGFEKATGEWIAFADDDDLWHPEKLSRQLSLVASQRDADGVICQTVWFRSVPGDFNFWFNTFDGDLLMRFLRLDVAFQTGSAIWRRDFINKVGLWDERLTNGQDLDFHTRCLCHSPVLAVEHTPLNFFRDHGSERVTRKRKDDHALNAALAMFNAYELLKDTPMFTTDRGLAIASTLMRQSRTLAFQKQNEIAGQCLDIAFLTHPTERGRRALRGWVARLNRQIADADSMWKAKVLRRISLKLSVALGIELPRVDWWQRHPVDDPAIVDRYRKVFQTSL